MSWTQAGGSPLGVVFGTGAYARDNQGNGRYTDMGDEAFWSFAGSAADFIRQVAADNGETVRFFSDVAGALAACPTGSTCAGFPAVSGTSGTGNVPGIPEPGQLSLMGVGLLTLLGMARYRRKAEQAGWSALLQARRWREGWFVHSPGHVDLCSVSVPVRQRP